MINLLEIGPIFQHFGGQIAVVGEEDQAAGIVIEAADRINTFGQPLETVAESFAAFRIGESGNHFGRFIEHDVDATLVGFNEFAGGFDAVVFGISFAAEFGH